MSDKFALRGFPFACLILLSVVYLAVKEIKLAMDWMNYDHPMLAASTNLTKSNQIWDVQIFADENVIESRSLVLPTKKFGELPPEATRVVFRSNIKIPDRQSSQPELAFHYRRIFADSFEAKFNGTVIASNATHKFNHNIALPRDFDYSQIFQLEFDLQVESVSEPGFDIRANLLVGPRIQLDRWNAELSERDYGIVVWLALPMLVVAMLFALGSIIFVYAHEYLLYSVFCVLSALKIGVTFGEFSLAAPGLLDRSTMINVLEIGAAAVLLTFIMAFFRKSHPLAKIMATFLFALALVYAATVKIWGVGSELFVPVFYFANFCYVAICAYGVFLAGKTYFYLQMTKRSRPRQMISLVVGTCFLLAIPGLIVTLLIGEFLWIGTSFFQLGFIVVLAATVSTDIGGVRAERDLIRRKLGVFVDEAKVSQIVKGELAERNWIENAAIMFIDIRNFCVMNEVFGSDAIFDAVNEYYQQIIECIYQNDGVVDKFIGDGVLAAWGITGAGANHTLKATHTAIELRKRIAELNARRKSQGKFQFSVGIGIHAGKVTSGVIGNDERAEYTIIGGTVNMAARIESHTKKVSADILLSEVAYERVKDKIIATPKGVVSFADQMASVNVYQPIGFVVKGKVITNEPIFDELNLNPDRILIENAPENLRLYNYKDFFSESKKAS